MPKQQIEVSANVVTGLIDGERVIQFRLENGQILTDTSACLPSRSPEPYVYLYMDCLNHIQTLQKEAEQAARSAHP